MRLSVGVLKVLLAVASGHSTTASDRVWWRHHGGLDCTTSPTSPSGASRHGLVSSTTPSTLPACKAACRSHPGCSAISTRTMNVSWSVHPAVNCYAGHGATELVDGDGTVNSCYAMSLNECRTQCLLTEGCTGAEYDTAEASGYPTGYCCLRGNIEVSKCDRGGTWELHLLTARNPIPEGSRPVEAHAHRSCPWQSRRARSTHSISVPFFFLVSLPLFLSVSLSLCLSEQSYGLVSSVCCHC